jgi:hypothetical protein
MYNESVATSTSTIYMVVSASQSASDSTSPSEVASPSLSEAASPVHTLSWSNAKIHFEINTGTPGCSVIPAGLF